MDSGTAAPRGGDAGSGSEIGSDGSREGGPDAGPQADADTTACELQIFYRDEDGDGFGRTDDSMEACDPPAGYVAAAGDCVDDCPTCHGDASEICDGLDNDCDELVDEASDEKCGSPEGACEEGVRRCQDGVLGDCEGGVEAGEELCDAAGMDEDCDDTVDEDCACTTDEPIECGDDTGACEVGQQACVEGRLGECMNAVGPASEVCDGEDNDCDGSSDEDVGTRSCGQNTGACSSGVERCVNGSWECRGEVGPSDETCDGEDNDCDGPIDEDLGSTWYPDNDGDGYGSPTGAMIACSRPSDYVANPSDCNDSAAAVHPNATDDSCDQTDNDCDNKVDEGGGSLWYRDGDSDGFGTASSTTRACSRPAGYVGDSDDCNDAAASINPSASDSNCDGADNDCDGEVDEEGGTTWYRDSDSDGYGRASSRRRSCTRPGGYVADNTDCNDSSNDDHPGASELCDSRDNDCDGEEDEDNVCCGDGIVQANEECDTAINGWNCSSSCTSIAGRTDTAYQECFEDAAPSICSTGAGESCASPGGSGRHLQCLPWDAGNGCARDSRYTVGRAENSPLCWLTCRTDGDCPDHMRCISSGAGPEYAPSLICVPD